MNKYIKKFITRGLITGIPFGVFIGQVVFAIFLLFTDVKNIETTKEQYFGQLISSAFTGFYCVGLSVVFNIEKWSLLKQTIINFLGMAIVYFPIAYFTGWMPKNFIGIAYFTLNYLIVYIVIWIIFKYKIRHINKQLSRQLNKINK